MMISAKAIGAFILLPMYLPALVHAVGRRWTGGSSGGGMTVRKARD
jgi:hypothetical protein